MSTTNAAAITAAFTRSGYRAFPDRPSSLEMRLEPGPHLLRELFQPRRVDEKERDARHLVDGRLDAGQGRVGGAEDVLHFPGAVAEGVLGHRLELGDDRSPVELRIAGRARWGGRRDRRVRRWTDGLVWGRWGDCRHGLQRRWCGDRGELLRG